MKQADIEVGTVYVGKCGKRFRYFDHYTISGAARCWCVRRYSRRGMRMDDSGRISSARVGTLARWAQRVATDEETAEVMAVMRASGWREAAP